MLRLQAEAISLAVDAALPSGDAAVEKVAGVELHARLGGCDLERASGRALDDARGVLELGARSCQHVIVIVPAAAMELDVVLSDPGSNRRESAEIERRAGNSRQLAGWNQRLVHRRVPVSVDLQLVLEHVSRIPAPPG